jgi:two-component system NarL family sensor kinase
MREIFFNGWSEFSDFIFQIAPIGILLANTKGEILRMNPFLQNLFQIKEDDMKDISILKYPLFKATEIKERFKETIKNNSPVVAECSIKAGIHKTYYLEYYFVPFEEKISKTQYIQGVVIDITKRRLVEEKVKKVSDYYEKILSSMSPLVTMDEKCSIIYTNEQFQKEFPGNEKTIVGKDFSDIVCLSKSERVIFKNNIASGKKIQNQEFVSGSKIFGYSIFKLEKQFGVILKEITKTRELEKKVDTLYLELLKLQEKERQKIAADLHDSVGQTILAAKLNLQAYLQDTNLPKERIQSCLGLIDQASQELREIYNNLYPNILKDIGLEAAIRSFIRSLIDFKKCNIEFNFKIKNKLAHDLEINLFRVTQEIVTNIVKHANATNLKFSLIQKNPRTIILEVIEDGIGFDQNEVNGKSKGFGLENMKRRISDVGGDIELNTKIGHGTHYKIVIPIKS